MDVNTLGHISDTAFLVNESRARRPDLSQDRYARYWQPPGSAERISHLWDRFAKEVYLHDDIELSIRNRFFLDQINTFFQTRLEGIFVNLGAGFTSYPYLLSEHIHCIEVDLPAISDYKKSRALELQNDGVLPQRSVQYINANFNEHVNQSALFKVLNKAIANRPCFFLLEGVSYYLKPHSFTQLISNISQTQKDDDIFAFDFWPSGISDQAVFKRLQLFFSKYFGQDEVSYNLLSKSIIKEYPNFTIAMLTDVVEQEKIYSNDPVLTESDQLLDENYAVLKRCGG